MVDWKNMRVDDVLDTLRSAPRVAGPWANCNDFPNGVRLYAQGMFHRLRAWPEPTWVAMVHVQPMTPGPGWSWWVTDKLRGTAATCEEAQRLADEALQHDGWRLQQLSPGRDGTSGE